MKYRLSQVQSARDDLGSFAGVGFNIVDERGAPIVTFGYLDQAKATNARALIEKAIVDVALIAPAGAYEQSPRTRRGPAFPFPHMASIGQAAGGAKPPSRRRPASISAVSSLAVRRFSAGRR
jgi:hypothetical protein